MKRPVIGLTTTLEEGARRHELWRAYPNAIDRAGGLSIILPTDDKYPHYEAYLDLLDGLLLTGGQDVLPSFYGQDPWGGLTETWPMCPLRDSFEINLTKLALAKGIPVLGLCRGLQLLVVALGGTLWQDVSLNGTAKNDRIRHFQNLDPRWPSHGVTLKEGLLKDILKTSDLRVNSLHHQAARQTPPGFTVVALANDGVVEAIEAESPPFALGVQWHPELLARTDNRQLALFKAFVDAAISHGRG
jgi:putative glutamine amidotransferase